MNFRHPWLFECCLLLILGSCHFRLYSCIPFCLLLLGVENSGVICGILELSGQNKSVAVLLHHFLVKASLGLFFLGIGAYPSEITWKPFCIDHVTINRFVCRPGFADVSDNATQ